MRAALLPAFNPIGDAIGEGIQDFFKGMIEGMAKMSWEAIKSSFSSSNMDASWWVSVVGGKITRIEGGTQTVIEHPGMLNTMVIIMVPILLMLAAVQVVTALFRQSTMGLVRAVVAAFFAVPLTYIVVGIMYTLIQIFDQLTTFILNLGSKDSGMAGVLAMFGMKWDEKEQKVLMATDFLPWSFMKAEAAKGQITFSVIMALIIGLLCLALVCMMVFRTMGLVIMACLAPIAVMSQSSESAKGLLSKWGTTVLGLMIAKPLAAMVIKIGMLLATTGDDITQIAAGIVAVVIAAAMPVMAGKFLGFINGGASDGIDQGGSHMMSTGARGSGRAMRGAGRGVRKAAIKV